MSIKSIRAALERHGQMTVSELCARCDIVPSTVSYQLKRLREKNEVYVSGWIMFEGCGPGRSTPVYSLGNEPDAAYTPRCKRAAAKAARAAKAAPKTAQFCDRAEVRRQAGMWGGLVCSA